MAAFFLAVICPFSDNSRNFTTVYRLRGSGAADQQSARRSVGIEKAIERGEEVGVVVGIEKALGRGDDVGGQDGVEEVRTVC